MLKGNWCDPRGRKEIIVEENRWAEEKRENMWKINVGEILWQKAIARCEKDADNMQMMQDMKSAGEAESCQK